MINLEAIWKPNRLPVTALIDCNVYLHFISSKYSNIDPTTPPELIRMWIKACWGIILNEPLRGIGASPVEDVQVILGNDFKDPNGDYWRNSYYDEYKGNRTPVDLRPPIENLINVLGVEVAKSQGIPVVDQENFEFDDMAGLAYHYQSKLKNPHPLVICTSDKDLTQLVEDKSNTYWLNALSYSPRLRSEYEVLRTNWESEGWHLSTPVDIVRKKWLYGDVSDNIKPMKVAQGIIDLITPIESPEAQPDLLKRLKNPTINTIPDRANAAVNWIGSNNLPLV